MPLEPSASRGGQSLRDGELYEMTEDGQLPAKHAQFHAPYRDGSSIDWLQEEASERGRKYTLRSQAGSRGLILPLLESARLWFVVIVTGLGIGITGAWLDVLVKWYVHSRK